MAAVCLSDKQLGPNVSQIHAVEQMIFLSIFCAKCIFCILYNYYNNKIYRYPIAIAKVFAQTFQESQRVRSGFVLYLFEYLRKIHFTISLKTKI